MVVKKTLKNGWEMKWIPDPTDAGIALHVSGIKGRCKIHRSGIGVWTAYLSNPFIPVGLFDSHELAMQRAEEYDKENTKLKEAATLAD